MDLAGQEPGEEDTSITLDINEDSPAQTLSDLAEMGYDYDSTIVGIQPGAGLMRLTHDSVIPTCGLDDSELIESSTPAMLGAVRSATKNGENIAVTMWHPHWACEVFPLRDPEDDGWVGGHQDRVSLERRDHVLIIRMERASKRNAVDVAMTEALDAALNLLDDDPDLWCGILTGNDVAFSAGTDLANTAGTPTERGGQYGVIKRQRRTPLIAAVDGLAFGGGFEIVLACDMVVASRSARFGLPEVARGVLPTCGGLFRAWHSLPVTVAKQMALTGRPLSAQRAYGLGLVNELTEDGQSLDGALELAAQVCENSPVSVAESLTVMNDVLRIPEEYGWQRTTEATEVVWASEDRAEGVAAFLEKRDPRWTGP